tara:strand:+ start:583 stop:1041 length:459 start_codon:yes stop_codon:yes gene_type:complete
VTEQIQAIFGKPVKNIGAGGTFLTIHIIPVYKGKLVAFDVTAPEAKGRWFPWTVLNYGIEPYEAAANLVDDWCEGSTQQLSLCDILTFMSYEGAWQISLVFRNELITLPHGDFERKPLLFDKELPTKIDKFQSADIERWINSGSTKTDQLVF